MEVLHQRCAGIDVHRDGVVACARVVHGGEATSIGGKGWFMQPTILDGVSNEMRVAREEIFGPIASVIRVKDYEEALSVAAKTKKGETTEATRGNHNS